MKKHVKTIYPRDRAVLSALARVGHLSEVQMRVFLRDKRIQDYRHDGFVQRVIASKPGKTTVCFKLTPAGHDLCRKHLGLQHTYHAQNPAHDLPLAQRYLALSQKEQQSWRTEADVRAQLVDQARKTGKLSVLDDLRNGKLSPPDAVYTSMSGDTIAFEVITHHYSAADITAKEDASDLLGCTFEAVRA